MHENLCFRSALRNPSLFFCSCTCVGPPGECRQLQRELLRRLPCSQCGSLQRGGETRNTRTFTLCVPWSPNLNPHEDNLKSYHSWCFSQSDTQKRQMLSDAFDLNLTLTLNLKVLTLNYPLEEVRKVSKSSKKKRPYCEAAGGRPCVMVISMHSNEQLFGMKLSVVRRCLHLRDLKLKSVLTKVYKHRSVCT